jgi:hypothetical protein
MQMAASPDEAVLPICGFSAIAAWTQSGKLMQL